jgi:hypothetical protein
MTTINKNSAAYKAGFLAYSAQPGNPYHEDNFKFAEFIQGQRDGMKANEQRLRELDAEERAGSTPFYFEGE